MNFFHSPKVQYPQKRLRRFRQNQWVRELVQESRLSVKDLIWPIFVREESITSSIPLMPGIERFDLKTLVKAVEKAYEKGISVIALFPVISSTLKSPTAEEAYNPDNLFCQSIRLLKKHLPQMGIITDVALDPYTTHGHDGIIHKGCVDNDLTLEALCRQALVQAEAGADIIAPSDMMDGRIQAIRHQLDKKGFTQVLILSYAVKYSSAFYGPFRQAVGIKQLAEIGDKKTYQLDSANSDMALHEAALDLDEGADMIMVKPGMPYLDVLWRVKNTFQVPTFAFQVSGEYASLKNAAHAGMINWEEAILESMLCFKRAGADGILTYAAPEIADFLNKK
jgi:porphobilinogen synthase